MTEQQPLFKPKTRGGYPLDEVSSALQKSIRRGIELEAVFWAMQLEMGYTKYLWRRLVVIYHEDVGLADPDALVYLETCRAHYLEMLEAGHPENLPLINAVVRLCRAPKTRLSVSLHLMVYETDLMLDMPDYAVDMHTERGKTMGRGMQHFHEVGNRLVNQNVACDPYEKQALRIGETSKLRREYASWYYATKAKKSKKAKPEDEAEPIANE